MKYLRSLMQQSVTACKNQAKLIQQFTLSAQFENLGELVKNTIFVA